MLIAALVILTLVFASLTVGEYYQANTLDSQLGQMKSAPAVTVTSTVTATSTAACPSSSACGTFSYSPIGQVKVDSVQAMIELPLGSGEQDVRFAVTFEDAGESPIYFENYALNSSLSSNSTIRQEACNCGVLGGVSGDITLDHGQNYTLFDPCCGNPYFYALLQGGTVNVTFTFNWTTDSQANAPSNSTTVLAQFIFP